MDRKMKTVDGIQAVRDEVNRGMTQLDRTVASLDDLVNNPQPDLRKQYKTYTNNLKKLEQTREQVRKRSASMRSRAQQYFEQWEKDIAATQRPPLQAVAIERRAAAQQSVAEITAEMTRAKESINPLADELADIRVYLSNDLTPQGIEAVRPIAAQVPAKAQEAKDSLNKILDVLRRVQEELSSGPVK